MLFFAKDYWVQIKILALYIEFVKSNPNGKLKENCENMSYFFNSKSRNKIDVESIVVLCQTDTYLEVL